MTQHHIVSDLNGTWDQAEQLRQTYWKLAAEEVLNGPYGPTEIAPEPFLASLGLAGGDVIPAVHKSLNEYGYDVTLEQVTQIYEKRKELLFNEGFDREGYPFREGGVDAFKELISEGHRICIVTSETLHHANLTLERNGIRDLVCGVVGRDTIINGIEVRKKPDRQPYTHGMEILREIKEINDSVLGYVLEDTAPGIFAGIDAKDAGEVQGVIHSRDIQSAATLSEQIDSQIAEKFGQPRGVDWTSKMDLTDAGFSEILGYFRDLRS